jgi:hypothetical protein
MPAIFDELGVKIVDKLSNYFCLSPKKLLPNSDSLYRRPFCRSRGGQAGRIIPP